MRECWRVFCFISSRERKKRSGFCARDLYPSNMGSLLQIRRMRYRNMRVGRREAISFSIRHSPLFSLSASIHKCILSPRPMCEGSLLNRFRSVNVCTHACFVYFLGIVLRSSKAALTSSRGTLFTYPPPRNNERHESLSPHSTLSNYTSYLSPPSTARWNLTSLSISPHSPPKGLGIQPPTLLLQCRQCLFLPPPLTGAAAVVNHGASPSAPPFSSHISSSLAPMSPTAGAVSLSAVHAHHHHHQQTAGASLTPSSFVAGGSVTVPTSPALRGFSSPSTHMAPPPLSSPSRASAVAAAAVSPASRAAFARSPQPFSSSTATESPSAAAGSPLVTTEVPSLAEDALHRFDGGAADPQAFLAKVALQKEQAAQRSAQLRSLRADISGRQAKISTAKAALAVKADIVLDLEAEVAGLRAELRKISVAKASAEECHSELTAKMRQFADADAEAKQRKREADEEARIMNCGNPLRTNSSSSSSLLALYTSGGITALTPEDVVAHIVAMEHPLLLRVPSLSDVCGVLADDCNVIGDDDNAASSIVSFVPSAKEGDDSKPSAHGEEPPSCFKTAAASRKALVDNTVACLVLGIADGSVSMPAVYPMVPLPIVESFPPSTIPTASTVDASAPVGTSAVAPPSSSEERLSIRSALTLLTEFMEGFDALLAAERRRQQGHGNGRASERASEASSTKSCIPLSARRLVGRAIAQLG